MMNHSASILRMALLLLLLLVYPTDAKMNIVTTSQDVLLGQQIILLCKAGDEGDITWLKDGEDVDSDLAETVDETSSKLNIEKATMSDAGKYTCHCEYNSGHKDDQDIQLFIYEGPSFGSTTTYHEFLQGTDAVVPCLVSGQPAVTVLWLRDGEEISSNEGRRVHQMQDNALRIGKVKGDDAGTYTCQAQIRGRPIRKDLPISVVINVPPSVHIKEEVKTVMAGPETNVSLLCLVEGHPKPNINWSMPVPYDPSHHQFNSDRSELTIQSVAREDYGEYLCTASNKISDSSDMIMLHVFEAPDVVMSAEQLHVSPGDRVSVSCNVSGHPQPELHWLNKQNGQTVVRGSTSGRVYVEDGVFVIKEVVPSDGGLYSCMAVGSAGNASRDVAILTKPGPPHYLSVSSAGTSVLFSLKTPPVSGGTPITGYALQWQFAEEKWEEVRVSSDALVISSLKPYTSYTVRLAAVNAEGVGEFSDTKTVRTEGIRGEPDSPVLKDDEKKIEPRAAIIPLKCKDDVGTPVLKYIVRYRQDKDGAEWIEDELPPNACNVSLKALSFSTKYQLEVTAVNANGPSIPAKLNFTTAAQGGKMTKGTVVGIVMFIFLLVFLVVDATCCYRNRCGLLMFIAVKLFGQKIPGLKGFEGGDGTTNGEVKLKGLSTGTGSMQQTGIQTLEVGQLREVTCDKAPLTKHE
ncbi:neural cell adhesion molecule 1 [Scomber japonicus]|uniref:neural cell adhesion molecule 1 n=1 Tax=Scomber japonicus TaxID=13676 RepID=UPI0023064819|nr:neural cell adhesion molecule 1 [Scomber japonicus]